MNIRRRTTAWGVVLATSLATLGLPTAAAAPTTASTPGAVAWEPCRPEPGDTEQELKLLPGSECATVTVPIDWNRPSRGTFELSIARRKAQQQRTGVLVFGPGGPGDSGVERIRTGMSRFSQRLEDRFDIVSFDPRGIARSNPVMCSAALIARQPSPIMKSQADFDRTVQYNRELAADCRTHTGALYDHLDMLQTVRDVEAIRRALGEQQISFHGSSYGTMLGTQYAEAFPQRVRALVLESVNDHSTPTTRRFLTEQAATAQDSFDEFVQWCADSTSCALHGRDVRALWAELQRRAELGQVPDPQRPQYATTRFMLGFAVFRLLYGPDWARLAQTLRALETSPPPTQQPPVPTGLAPFSFAPFCQDWDLPLRDYREYAGLLKRVGRANPEMRYPGQLMAITTCLGLPRADNPQHVLKVRDLRTPALLTNSLHDPATGYEWARNVARQLGRQGVLLTYEGWGHGSYTTSPCVEALVDNYLVDLTVPPRGTRCAAILPTA
ncbi:TAP domain protein [Kribbella flavida DSM 17836]|uniref:TAP domain protein n=1 Tax=Kribbella flavida (strain DSM 17836 / JCM 10339 / NBRC 14399) TaxID=479435 RepID=D2PYH2_KRIFD|nr:alpha/beta hydrolase [Kribbella flavida]ADB35540.1 TAP domain protein [Kribbella flavida DSM 17836]